MSTGVNLSPIAAWQEALRPGTWSTVWGDDFPWHYVSEEEALGLPVVAGFMSITSSLLLQMPLEGLRRNPDGSLTPIDPKPTILINPTPGIGRTIVDFANEYLHDMVLYGNYVAILGPRNPAGWPEMIVPIPVGQWQVNIDERTGAVTYLVNGQIFQATDVFHVMMNKASGQLVGRGALQLYQRLIASSVAAERWATLFFEGGAVPPGAVKSNNPDLTQAQADSLKSKMRTIAMAREWAVLPGGTDLQVLSSDAESAQLNETRKLNAQQLAMAMGIPGALLGLDSPSLTYRNITDVFQQFITTTVMSYLVPLEQQLSSQCLPRTTDARFVQANVLRPDLPARVGLANETLASGLFDRDEARRFFGLGVTEATID